MRDPNNLNIITVNSEPVEVILIEHLPEYAIQSYDLLDEKDFKKYIEDIEKSVRTSFEYRRMVKYLRENMNMSQCSFYENVNNIDTTKIKIHIHHEPLTLYDISLIVFNKRQFYKEPTEVEMVAKEVTALHYSMLVGLIPLAETPHELVHNQYLFVPADRVLGYYNVFIDLYHDFMTAEQLDILDRIFEATKIYNANDVNVLDKKYVYVDVSGNYKLPPMEDIKSLIEMRLDALKESKNVFEQEGNNLINPISFNK